MPRVLATLSGKDLERWQFIAHEVEAGQMSVNDLSFAKAVGICERETDFMGEMREKHGIEPEEEIYISVSTGAIIESQ